MLDYSLDVGDGVVMIPDRNADLWCWANHDTGLATVHVHHLTDRDHSLFVMCHTTNVADGGVVECVLNYGRAAARRINVQMGPITGPPPRAPTPEHIRAYLRRRGVTEKQLIGQRGARVGETPEWREDNVVASFADLAARWPDAAA